MHYVWMRENPAYPAAFEEMQAAYCDFLRSLIRFRTFHSDLILIFEAKQHMPEYRDKVDLEHSGGIEHRRPARYDKLSDAELE